MGARGVLHRMGHKASQGKSMPHCIVRTCHERVRIAQQTPQNRNLAIEANEDDETEFEKTKTKGEGWQTNKSCTISNRNF